MKKIILLLAALTLSAGASARKAPLHIVSGAEESTTSAAHTVVGITAPGASASVNGRAVKVYSNTGCFGTELGLRPGKNKIHVKVRHGKLSADTTFEVTLVEAQHPVPKAKKPAKRETIYPEPFAVSTDSGAYLQYGPGSDRLGGSKMGFLDRGIILTATGEYGDLYRVRLSDNRYAYLPKEYAHRTEDNAVRPTLTTGSWTIQRRENCDRVTISLPARLPYTSWTDDGDPSTICVELYGAADNSNWITQRTLDLGIIDRVDFRQVESDVYRMLIRLKSSYVWGYTASYGDGDGSVLRIDVRHAPQTRSLKGLHVGLDAGHGGKYPGARSVSGLLEKDINLDIVLKLRDMLEQAGARVTLTRDSDTEPSMTERKRILRDAGVDISISVHNNAGGGPLASPGTSALYKHSFDRPLAVSIARRLLELDVTFYGLVGNFNFSLNGPTDYPNMLVEGLFMSSLEEENLLADPEFRTRMARQIMLGLEDYMREAR